MQQDEKLFTKAVRAYFKKNGRHELPWRLTKDPYHILVSEVMLQQTQVDRVISKYNQFLSVFPGVRALARASLGDVLREWQGLGYNRRAKSLHTCAKVIVEKYRGKLPDTYEELQRLPGIGAYTAGAIMAFAHNKPVPIIETNVRSVYLHHFFDSATDVSDTELLNSIAKTLDTKNPREWYWALMDYGAYIKKEFGNPNSKSKHYSRQATFVGSDRQIRGAILRVLAEREITRKKLHTVLNFDVDRIDVQIQHLLKEGMIAKRRQNYLLPV